ncbi:hypothetical protein V5799_022252, partial [Amblyomma americanum]
MGNVWIGPIPPRAPFPCSRANRHEHKKKRARDVTDATIRVPSGTSGVFVAFACCGLLLVLMQSLSTLALVRPGALPWSDSNRSGPGHSHLRNPEAVFAAEVQGIMAPEGDTTAEAPRLQSPAPAQETRDRGSFVLLPAELYTNSSRQFFCFYQ